MFTTLGSALRVLAVLTTITGIFYPLAVTGLARVLSRSRADGSLIVRQGRVIGSELIGQSFSAPGDFWGRPSATSVPYDASASTGSNLGPTNPALDHAVRARIAVLRAADPAAGARVPADLVTASASGLDPDISVEAAEYQLARVARARGIDPRTLRALVAKHTAPPTFGVLGEPRVRVLTLNLELDRIAAMPAQPTVPAVR